MAENESDYHIDEDLEQLFHSDLKSLELGHTETSTDDIIGDRLPEWLVGVIIVIIMLLVAFLIMVVTSLAKNRIKKKNQSSTYVGAGSSRSCDDLESGKISAGDDHGMKVTLFSSVPDPISGNVPPSQSNDEFSGQDHMTSSSRSIHGHQGCRNPLFVDDEADSDDNKSRSEIKNDEEKDKTSSSNSFDLNMPSASSDLWLSDENNHGKSKGTPCKYNLTSYTKKPLKIMELEGSDQFAENEGGVRKWIIASKTKSGTQSLNKRERIKKSNDVIASHDDITQRDEGEERIKILTENEVRRNSRKICSNENVKENDNNGCCEDSGVEVGSLESHLKDETGGTSESDDTENSIVMTISEGTSMECSKGESAGDIYFQNIACCDLSQSLVKSAVLPGDNTEESQAHSSTNTSSQISSNSVVEHIVTQGISELTEEQENVPPKHSAALGTVGECLQLDVQENMADTEISSLKQQNSVITSVTSKTADDEKETTFSLSSSSDVISLIGANMAVPTIKCTTENCLSDASSKAVIVNSVTIKELVSFEKGDEIVDADKLLSTNL